MSTISMDLVKKLRDQTQVGMMDCKKALEQADGDFEQAVEILRKKGAAVSAKRAENATNHGRIEGFVDANGATGALIEMACETDFAAKTEAMQHFTNELAEHIAQHNPSDVDALMSQKLAKAGVSVQQHLDGLIAKICEKIKINRFARFNVTANGLVNIYIHPGSTVAVMVALTTDKAATAHLDELKAAAKDICMQIAVTNPVCIKPADMDQQILEKERALAREQLKDSNKPANVIEKIVEGKLGKFYQDACLNNQPFIKNDKLTVEQYLAEASKKTGIATTIKQFKRFAIGR